MTDTTDPREQEYDISFERRLLNDKQPDNLHDVYLILKHHEAWKDRVALDDFSQRIVKLPVPGDGPYPEWREGDWTEVDDCRTANWLAVHYNVKKVATSTIAEAISMVADDNRFHPVREYLDSLEWDGTPRVDDVLGEYMEAPYAEADLARYTQLVVRIWMLSAVARIYEPGCKADYVLILEGDQRIGKSTFFNILADSWFSDTPFDIRDKDAYQHLTGKWIIELQELDSFNKAETTRLKAFFSSRIDNYRPPYGRRNKDFPRQCVFAGTTNQTEYLRDNTGNLRFMPVYVRRLNAEALARDREQIWAEAVHRYKNGEAWFPEWADFELMAKHQTMREISDPREDKIERWLMSREPDWGSGCGYDPITTEILLHDVLDVPRGAENLRWKASEVGKIMRKLGWKKKQISRENDRLKFGRHCYVATKAWEIRTQVHTEDE